MNKQGGSVTSDEVTQWREYIGRTETRHQFLDVESARRFAAAVGSNLDVEQHLPPLAHWAYFLEAATLDWLGNDGHLKRDRGLLPPVHLPRRMFAATSIRFIEPLVLGRDAELAMTLIDVKYKERSADSLVFVEVERTVSQTGVPCVSERQTIVYRAAGKPLDVVIPMPRTPRQGERTWTPTPVELFRFSAVTFNSHRIHYDRTYAEREEGYPGLVVHGPLTATKLLTYARDCSSRPVRQFDFRVTTPMFADQPIYLSRSDQPSGYEVIRCDGAVAASARATF